jgi:hypothetical protein
MIDTDGVLFEVGTGLYVQLKSKTVFGGQRTESYAH